MLYGPLRIPAIENYAQSIHVYAEQLAVAVVHGRVLRDEVEVLDRAFQTLAFSLPFAGRHGLMKLL